MYNLPDAYSFSCNFFLVVTGVISICNWKGSNINPLSTEYINTPSVVAAAHDKPNYNI